MTVRTRIAPSPTGSPHLGTAYIALFNLCFARSSGGQCILRIEDTDRVRSSKVFEERILDALKWLGLSWDEGPDLGGEFGPYRQSERHEIYQHHGKQLLDSGHAFRCFCTPERLNSLRKEQMASNSPLGYDGRCAHLSSAEIEEKLSQQTPCVVRMHMDREGSCIFQDQLRGNIEIEWRQMDMQVLLKSDGMPTYHLACVVDDHMMGISHVIRGEEWINSTPKHLKLYQYFGWKPPVFCHLPLLRNPDQSKLSKRRNPTSIDYYRKSGLLPEALLNYLALIGGAMPNQGEIFTLHELIDAFDIEKVSLGAPIFDVDKLDWLAGQWLRQLSKEELLDRFLDWLPDRHQLIHLVGMVQPRVERFGQVLPKITYLLGDAEKPEAELLQQQGLDMDTLKRLLHYTLLQLSSLEDWSREAVQQALSSLASLMGLKTRLFLKPLFIAISGHKVALPLFDSIAFIGREEALVRLQKTLKSIGGLSRKERERIDKEWHLLNRLRELAEDAESLKEQLCSCDETGERPPADILDSIDANLKALLELSNKARVIAEKKTAGTRGELLQKLCSVETLWTPEQWAMVKESCLPSKRVSEEGTYALAKKWEQLDLQHQALVEESRMLSQNSSFSDSNSG